MKDNKNNKTNNYIIVSQFSAIEKTLQDNMDYGVENDVRNVKFVTYGEKNLYKEWLYSLYQNNSNLQSIINGTTSFCTYGVESTKRINEYDEIDEMLGHLISDYLLFGEAYLLVCRDSNFKVRDVYWTDAQFIRVDKDEQAYFYSEDWDKSYGRVKTVVYPKFLPNGTDYKSILAIKTPQSRGVYGMPLWKSAVKSVLIENKIDDFHLNNISNGFFPSVIINLNNGVPEDEVKAEIEKDFNEKFCGAENAGRFVLSFNDGLQNKTTIEKLEPSDYSEKFNTLATRARQEIYVAFGATPNLFGLPTETTGFNSQEFDEAFKIYYNAMILPVQTKIKNAFKKAYGEDILTFGRYSLE